MQAYLWVRMLGETMIREAGADRERSFGLGMCSVPATGGPRSSGRCTSLPKLIPAMRADGRALGLADHRADGHGDGLCGGESAGSPGRRRHRTTCRRFAGARAVSVTVMNVKNILRRSRELPAAKSFSRCSKMPTSRSSASFLMPTAARQDYWYDQDGRRMGRGVTRHGDFRIRRRRASGDEQQATT